MAFRLISLKQFTAYSEAQIDTRFRNSMRREHGLKVLQCLEITKRERGDTTQQVPGATQVTFPTTHLVFVRIIRNALGHSDRIFAVKASLISNKPNRPARK